MTKAKKPTKAEVAARFKKEFEHYACLGCGMSELSGILWIEEEELQAWIEQQYGFDYDEVLTRFRGKGIAELRESIREFATTNAHVAKWLGQLMFGDTKTAGDDVTVKIWGELDPNENLKKAKKSPDENIKEKAAKRKKKTVTKSL